MGSYNWVVFDGRCPSCGDGAEIRAQVHSFASYDGDADGRRHDRTYRIGDCMKNPENAPDISAVTSECCYSDCLRCGAELFCILEFEGCSPIKTLDVGLAADWPAAYPK